MLGVERRLARIFPSPSRGLFSVPLDHSVSMGPIDGLESTRDVVRDLVEAGVDLVIVPPGSVRGLTGVLPPSTLLGIHLSGSTTLGATEHRKVLVGSPAGALGLGADLVSVQVNFGVPDEPEMLAALGRTSEEAHALGLPVLAMAYVKSAAPPTESSLRHAARAAADLGADIVKTSYPGSTQALANLVRSTPVPVLLGGGVRLDNESEALDLIRATRAAGARGICFGRNLFQRTPLVPFARRVAAIVHESS